MTKKSPHPLLRIAFGFAGGIAAYRTFSDLNTHATAIAVMLVLILVFMLYVIFSRSNRPLSLAAGFATVLAFALAGMLAAHTDALRKIHCRKQAPTGASFYSVTTVSDRAVSGSGGKYVVQAYAAYTDSSWTGACGRGLLYLRDDTLRALRPGTELMVRGNAQQLPPTLNPGNFDYRAYLHRKGIFFRDFISMRNVRIMKSESPTAGVFFLRINQHLQDQLQTVIEHPENRAIANAMLLGNKGQIDPSLREAYSAAGASHILAVSGLHVGILFLALHILLVKLKSSAAGTLAYYTLVLSGIWVFAAITAFSPSVTRAGIMISFVLLGRAMRSGNRMLNSLSGAAFFMLLFDPDLLLDVGFQLSFGAVAGIALFYKGIYHGLPARHAVLDYLWKIIALSLAVQIAIAPLVALYFHQFPLLFPLTNIIVIPATGFILVCTLLLLALSFTGMPVSWAGELLDAIIGALNAFVRAVESLPFSHLEHISITPAQTLMLTCLLGCSAYYILKKKAVLLVPAAAGGFFLLFLLSRQALHNNSREGMVVYAQPGDVTIDLVRGRTWSTYSSQGETYTESAQYILEPARLLFALPPNANTPLSHADILAGTGWNLVVFGGKRILVLENPDIPPDLGMPEEPDMIVIRSRISDRTLQRILDAPPGRLLYYSTLLENDQRRLLSEQTTKITTTDLCRGAFISGM